MTTEGRVALAMCRAIKKFEADDACGDYTGTVDRNAALLVEAAFAAIEAHIAALADAGLVIRPREPTKTMAREGADCLPIRPGSWANKCAVKVYQAMIAEYLIDNRPQISDNSEKSIPVQT